jgi:hypothetical protein
VAAMKGNCTFAAITAFALSGILFISTTPTDNADKRLIADNKELKAANALLQDRLIVSAAEAKKAYDDAAKALSDEKKRVTQACGK